MIEPKFKQVIIWGHKPKKYAFGLLQRRHTHSYIHEGYFRAFRHMGYRTFWLDELDNFNASEMEDSLFFTEDQAQRNIPVLSSGTYILHHTDNDKFLDQGSKVLNLCNYVKPVSLGLSFNYQNVAVEKLDELTYYDSKNRALYQPWATNLLPSEFPIDFGSAQYNSNAKEINYVGSVSHEDLPQRFSRFNSGITDAHVKLKFFQNISEKNAQRLVVESRISVDVRGAWHKEIGYIPCRIWKSLSYGKFVGSNSPHMKEVFGDYIAYHDEEQELYNITQNDYKNTNLKKIMEFNSWIKSNHTYINRIKNLMKIIQYL